VLILQTPVLARHFLPRSHIPDVAHSFACQVMPQRQYIAHFWSCGYARQEDVNDSHIVEVCACAAQAAINRGACSVANSLWLLLCHATELVYCMQI